MSSVELTSSRTGVLYFAYGSNLSPFQMVGRCPSSGIPLALARLDAWSWIITKPGYANIVSTRPTETSRDSNTHTVWGIVYNLTPRDEASLDICEGWSDQESSDCARGPVNPVASQKSWKPYEQGKATYNKLYLPLKIEKWLIPKPMTVLGISEKEYTESMLRCLIYVDERNLIPGNIAPSYVPRMGRAARESIALGLPERYVLDIFGPYGIDKNDPESFTNDIMPSSLNDAEDPQQWQELRRQLMGDANQEQ